MSDLGCPIEAMDVERPAFSEEWKGATLSPVSCSICLEPVADPRKRSAAKLQCGHEFHLDCIGSAFNAKGTMQCPNCRKVEKGRWLYANGYLSSAEFNIDELMNEDLYDFSYSEMPFGFQWCPFRGFTQLASLLEEGDLQPNAYHDLLGGTTFGDSSASSSSTHMCPYLAMHAFHHGIHSTSSNGADALPDVGLYHRHPGAMGGPSSIDMMNSHNPATAEPQHHNWQQQQQPSLPFHGVGNVDQAASQVSSSRLPRDSSGQQRLGSFVHPHHFLHGSAARNGTNVIASMAGLPIMGDARGHGRGGAHGNHMFQQSGSSSSHRNTPFPPIRRARPRGLALFSSVAATTSSSAEIAGGGFYGFSISAGSASRSHQDSEGVGRHFDHFYGWGGRGGEAGFAPLPWIPMEGESQWWSPFHPNQQNPQLGSVVDSTGRNNSSYLLQRSGGGSGSEIMQGHHLENDHGGHVPLPRMSPF